MVFFLHHTNLVWKDAFLGDICFDKGCCKGFIWECVAGVLCRKWFTSANAGSVFEVGGWVIGLIEVIRRSPTAGAPLPKLGPSIGNPPLPVMKYFTWCFIIQKILFSVTITLSNHLYQLAPLHVLVHNQNILLGRNARGITIIK